MRQFLIAAVILGSTMLHGQHSDLTDKKVLIYTWVGEGYVHDNISASVLALEEICKGLNIVTENSDDPEIFEKKQLKKFDAIIFSNTNKEAFLNEQQRNNFQQFIRSGKGFIGIHSANTSEPDWAWYRQMVGGVFVRHPELQPFDIKVIDGRHLSTAHLPEVWEWEDECYYSNHLNPAIHVLLAVDLTTIDDAGRSDFPGNIFGDLFPLAWYHCYEGNRVFYTSLGHKIEHYRDENFRKHLEGGIAWVLMGH